MSLPAMVYDRTAADVANKTDKGYHNVADLQRVVAGVQWVHDQLELYGIPVDIVVNTSWSAFSYTISNLENIRVSIQNLRAAYYVYDTTPDTPSSLDRMDYLKANDIEKILVDLDSRITTMVASFQYSGSINCGEVAI